MILQIKYGKLSGYKVGKIPHHFIVDMGANKTAELVDINRNTVDGYYNLFRKLIYQRQKLEFQKLSGIVELDESYYSARQVRGHHIKLKRGRDTRKQPVSGIYERGGRVYTEIVPSCSGKLLQAIIEHIAVPKVCT